MQVVEENGEKKIIINSVAAAVTVIILILSTVVGVVNIISTLESEVQHQRSDLQKISDQMAEINIKLNALDIKSAQNEQVISDIYRSLERIELKIG